MTQRSTQRADKQLQTVERRRGRTWGVDKMKGLAIKAVWFIAALMLSVQVQADTYYFHNDHLGTPQVLTDDTQTVVWKGEYDPFGQVTETVSTVEQNLRFPGQYYDQETGLHYNYFRTYDPNTGRYVESDPIGLGGGLSTYGYVGANPLIRFDLLGLEGDHIYDGVNTFYGGEVHFGVGGGFTYVTCGDECGKRRTMVFVKVCAGFAAGVSGGAGYVSGLEGSKCVPGTYAGLFGELGVSLGYLGGSLDIGNGVVEAGASVGGGAQAGFCYYIYVGDS